MLLFEGTFDNDMMVESAASRQARGETFIQKCDDMDALLYAACLDVYDTMGYATAVYMEKIAVFCTPENYAQVEAIIKDRTKSLA